MTGAWIAVLAVAVGTYLFRVAGPLLADRFDPSDAVRHRLGLAATALLAALIATAALTEAGAGAGWARPIGVLVGAVAAWRRVPFVVVVLLAAGTAAALRALGVP